MKAKLLLISTITFFSLTNCQEKKLEKQNNEKVEENKMEISEIKNVLIKQIKSGPGSEYWGEDEYYTKQDLDALVFVEDTILKNNGYKTPEKGIFNQKIKAIFGRIIDNQSESSYLKINRNDKCDKDIDYQPVYTGLSYIYVAKKNNFITAFYSLPSILDYQKIYPDISKYEENPLIFTYTDGTEQKISRWKDLKDLPQQRRFNQQLLISRNKYLFNDDKSQFSWLITNDAEFMRSLVTTFGYTEDEKLLKWVIENTDLDFYNLRSNKKLNFAEFGSLFWTKNCEGKLKLHSNTFKIYQELYKPNDSSTMRFLLDYTAGYLEYLFDENNYKDILTEEEKVKIGANLVYFAEQYKYNPDFKDSRRMMGRFRYFIIDDLKGILKKNKYYNLPKFKEWWDKAEYDKDFVVECEYGGVCGRDNPGPDPTDPKYKNSQF